MKKMASLAAMLLVLVMMVGTLAACHQKGEESSVAADEPLTGRWTSDKMEGYDLYFNEDGTGKSDSRGYISEYTYTVAGDQLTYHHTKSNSETTKTFTIKGDLLTIKDDMGGITTYKKVK